MSLRKTTVLLFILLLLLPSFLVAQGIADPVDLIGLTLNELISRMGVPVSVHSARGAEEWQDDVVFVYDWGDVYIIKDRVWQAGFKSAMGIKAGDSAASVSLILGSSASARLAENRQNSVFYFLDGKSWPIMLRCDFDRDGRVTVIYIYRSDL